MLLGALISRTALSPRRALGQAGAKSADAEKQSVTVEQGESDGLRVFALRLRPGQDLRKEIERFARERGITGARKRTTGEL